MTAVRDSRGPDDPRLLFGGDGWKAFIDGVKTDEFTLDSNSQMTSSQRLWPGGEGHGRAARSVRR
ncbi:hypothetical protein C1I98_08485 [Spongiactinospora gelatinilytica]|uniref:DUF397 domain-containing protein n=1 Tax=Spongiactinospora gelatinilytica TaxID=2666298 RepID=A0A2W2HIH0_9ACTN|nr:DUF397 domain-containing protein [Spongiactinospora gelatinilytica]PZG51465.1 hypothetical protein C1I98_08485 [Spongiactinospora gelatinilytica]